MTRKNSSNKLLWLFCLAVSLTISCKKTNGVIPPNYGYATSMSEVFDDYWNGMNTNYVFWDIDSTNWDRVYRVYKDSFAALTMTDSGAAKAYKYFQEITSGLKDSHYNINFYTLNLQNDSSVNPARTRKGYYISQSLAHVPRYFDSIILYKYLDYDSGYYANVSYNETNGGATFQTNFEIVTGTIHKHIVYFRINQFDLTNQLQSGNTDVALVWSKFVTYLHSQNTYGLIVDMRSNSGGNLADLNNICGEVTDTPIHFAYLKEKSGNGRFDYTPWAKVEVAPTGDGAPVNGPIVVLTDRNSVSMAEMTTMALKILPNTYIIGDTTWGANGPLVSEMGPASSIGLYGGGQFEFGGGNGFGYVYTSTAQYKYIDGKIYEHIGFPPDRLMPYNQDSVSAGADIQLKAAIKYIDSLQ